MSMKNTETIYELTTTEIARQTAPLNARYQEIVSERAANYRSALKNGGGGATPILDPDERAAREHAKHLLNGSAPGSLLLPPEITRDRALLREQRGIEIALKIFASKDLIARASEAVEWAEEHHKEWLELCRAITLTAIRLDALEDGARQLLEQCGDIHSVRLPMGNVIGGRAICETRSISDLAEAAMAAGVVTASEVKKSKAVAP
jgi:hypothetical protein